MALSLRVAARAWIFKLYRVVFLYSGFLFLCLSFKFKVVGGGPTCQSLFRCIRLSGATCGKEK